MNTASKYIVTLFSLIKDCSRKCSTEVLLRDMITIIKRSKDEGLSFLTITLPNFGDSIFNAIERGSIISTDFVGWRKSGCLPAFLQGFTKFIFDKHTGRLLNEHETHQNAVQSIRQITFFFKKINLPCTSERIAKAIRSYEQIEDDLSILEIPSDYLEAFTKIARVCISESFGGELSEEDLLPHHGPGSTMEKVVGNSKYIPSKFPWYNQLDTCFSKGLTIYSSEEHARDDQNQEEIHEEPYVRVVHVPKTLKTPRIIALEPVVMQMTQQSVKDFLVKKIEASYLMSGHVNFRSQSINQRLALNSSVTRRLATLDLSSASDRVHNELVLRLFEVNPSLSDLVQCTRSPLAKLGDKFIRLNKFASMGSALCFPVESLTFFIQCLVVRWINKGRPPLSTKTLYNLSREIYVYGDDILVPVNEVDSIVTALTTFGNVVNRTKSYFKSNFRESCGCDAYNGVDITPIYLRRCIPNRKDQAQDIVSLVATCNQLFKKGYYGTYELLKEYVHKSVGFVLPAVGERCSGLGWVDESRSPKSRYHRKLQRYEVQTLVPQIRYKKDRVRGAPALFKCLMRLERRPIQEISHSWTDKVEQLYLLALSEDEQHLNRCPVRGALTLKRRWVTPL